MHNQEWNQVSSSHSASYNNTPSANYYNHNNSTDIHTEQHQGNNLNLNQNNQNLNQNNQLYTTSQSQPAIYNNNNNINQDPNHSMNHSQEANNNNSYHPPTHQMANTPLHVTNKEEFNINSASMSGSTLGYHTQSVSPQDHYNNSRNGETNTQTKIVNNNSNHNNTCSTPMYVPTNNQFTGTIENHSNRNPQGDQKVDTLKLSYPNTNSDPTTCTVKSDQTLLKNAYNDGYNSDHISRQNKSNVNQIHSTPVSDHNISQGQFSDSRSRNTSGNLAHLPNLNKNYLISSNNDNKVTSSSANSVIDANDNNSVSAHNYSNQNSQIDSSMQYSGMSNNGIIFPSNQNPQNPQNNYMNTVPNATSMIRAGSSGSLTTLPGRGKGSRPAFNKRLPNKTNNGATLTLIQQPVTEHRARYESEGNRGVIKNGDGSGYPTIKLSNYRILEDPAEGPSKVNPGIVTLVVYCVKSEPVLVGNDPRPKPHRFFKPVAISGKVVTSAEDDMENFMDASGENYKFHVLKITWDLRKMSGNKSKVCKIESKNSSRRKDGDKNDEDDDAKDNKYGGEEYDPEQTDWVLPVDCLSILKLRVCDLKENEINRPQRPKQSKKCASFNIKLCFRLTIQEHSGIINNQEIMTDSFSESSFEEHHIQVLSESINCKQPEGMPEIIRMQHKNSYNGKPAFYIDSDDDNDRELWIFGRNFALRNTKVRVVGSNELKEEKDLRFLETHSVDCLRFWGRTFFNFPK